MDKMSAEAALGKRHKLVRAANYLYKEGFISQITYGLSLELIKLKYPQKKKK